ncbi:DUF983 domain-containing protein [Flagellimonas sp. 389]|uniref:DUF983 domain-containing protein n=1 Tax=Flagellimonas sp. 389 TaxID=2835862 RepID=UPI001BD40F29|nr:DUF983 domain-containing protein [Flagellimonas sp. 389]MBS9461962.1 DUF983 domain-containing protein [Flagellimonas sp. 389]
MLKKGNKLYSILTGSCPRCHEENMYANNNPYAIGQIFKMHERCSNCGLKYKIEPSFFYGSMYVSYGVGIAFAVAAFVIVFLIVGASLVNTFIAIVLTLIVFMPVIIRLSRNIWINFFIKYEPKGLKGQLE